MEKFVEKVKLASPDRSTHNLTSETKTTTDFGKITPVYCQEVVPGDTVTVGGEMLVKLMPLITPLMHKMTAYIHYFYVPNRLLWDNWKYFISNNVIPKTGLKPTHPYIDLGPDSFNPNGVQEYFNWRNEHLQWNPMALSAYQLIWNEYYRHQKLQDDIIDDIKLADGNNASKTQLFTMRTRTRKGDYFTECLPSPQQGDSAQVDIFDFTDAPVKAIQPSVSYATAYNTANLSYASAPSGSTHFFPAGTPDYGGTYQMGTLFADLSTVKSSLNIQDFREALRVQEFLERNNIAGNRYNEFIKAHFGVQVPDLRVSRPQYIAGVKQNIAVSEVLNTADSYQGRQTGQAMAYEQGHVDTFQVQEHGIILGLFTLMSENGYTDSIQKLHYKRELEDYYLPTFDQLGETEVKNKEIHQYHQNPDATFGYMPRYADYRVAHNVSTAEMNTTYQNWHLNRALDVNVALNEDFINQEVITTPFAVQNGHNVLVQVLNQCIISRPMSFYSTPTLESNK